MFSKKSFLPIALLFCATAALAAPKGSLRYTVVVDKFENATNNPRALGDEWSTVLTTKLHESGHFIVVAQSDMQLKALNEQIRGASGTTAQGKKTAVRGQMTPAQLLVKGVITNLKEGSADQGGGFGFGEFRVGGGRAKTEIRATMQMIDASTGALVAAKDFVGIASKGVLNIGNRKGDVKMGKDDNVHEAFDKAMTQAIPWMVEQLPSVQWRGTVVKVDKERIIVNRGLREGVSVGDEFVVGESEVIRDPDTGEVIDEVIRERARLKVVSVGERTSVCSVISGSGNQVGERMTIRYSSET
ncbi:MAG TPA: CsgG/HfaB family protein [Thermoanaerobaculia bacterium]|nr:CsgG/HfaB family protein [Thermoanaerobaculia bacterium]